MENPAPRSHVSAALRSGPSPVRSPASTGSWGCPHVESLSHCSCVRRTSNTDEITTCKYCSSFAADIGYVSKYSAVSSVVCGPGCCPVRCRASRLERARGTGERERDAEGGCAADVQRVRQERDGVLARARGRDVEGVVRREQGALRGAVGGADDG